MLTRPEGNPAQTGAAQKTSRLNLMDETRRIWATDKCEYTGRDFGKRWESWNELGKYMENEAKEKLDNY